MNKHFILIVMVLLWSFTNNSSFGQGVEQAPVPVGAVPDPKMMSGTATGAGFSGVASPNLFNGSMNINVPIYNFKHDEVDYGVSLTYNTQGVKVDEFASSIGLHWNLNCGASIARVARDLPDELLIHGDSLLETTLYYNALAYDSVIANKEMHIYGRLFTYGESQTHLNAANAYADHESDEFAVSIFGKGFKFYIGEDLKVFITSPQNYKVELLADDVPVTNISQISNLIGHTLNFKITDNKGIQYVFQANNWDHFDGAKKFWDWQQIVSTPDGYIPSYPSNYPVRWRLKEVKFPDGQSITYKYNPNLPAYPSVSDFLSRTFLNYYVRDDISLYQFLGTSAPKPQGNPPVFLEIDYPNDVKVNFEYNTEKWNLHGRYLLKEIKISSGGNCKKFRLYQDSVNTRYYLDSIRQVSCNGTQSEPYYSFDYNRYIYVEFQLPNNLPPYQDTFPALPKRLNTGQDLFGYYNGDSMGTEINNSGNKISIPKHNPPNITNYGNEREYNAELAQGGLLKTIKNAYGEEQRFVYGPIVISNIPMDDSMPSATDKSFIGISQPDGVCIDSIVSTDPAHPYDQQITTFSYSGGQLFMPGGYFHYPERIDSATGNWRTVIYQSMFLTPHQLVNGANHGFSKVDIKTYADAGLLSRRVITYTNMQDGTSNNEPRFFRVPGSKRYFQYPYTNKQYLKDWEIGLPLSITDYDQNNRILKKVSNNYDFSSVNLSAASFISNTRIVKVNKGTGIGGTGYPDLFYPNKEIFTDNYYPFKGKATLARTVTQKYISDSRFVSDTVWYAYDSRNNLSSTITQDSKGEKTATQMIYNYDVDGPQYASSGNPGYTAHPGTTLYNMSEDGLEQVISTERWKLLPGTNITSPDGGAVKQNNDRLLSSFITGYRYQNGKLWTKSLWNTQTGNPLSYTEYTGLVPGVVANPYGKVLGAYNSNNPVTDFIKTSSVTLFNAKGNPLETQLQDEDQYKAMIWDTATGRKLAEAANCRYSDIAYTSFEDNLTDGNLSVSTHNTTASSGNAITGTHTGLLWTQMSPGTAISISGTKNLKANKEYILSFWIYGTPPLLKVGSQAIPISSANVTYTKGSWKNYQVRFTPSSAGKIKITGAAAFSQIDEIRLFPADAQMQSWTYEPLFGKSSQTDPSGQITYYRYDKMGRQNLVLDMDGNILSKTNYQVAQ